MRLPAALRTFLGLHHTLLLPTIESLLHAKCTPPFGSLHVARCVGLISGATRATSSWTAPHSCIASPFLAPTIARSLMPQRCLTSRLNIRPAADLLVSRHTYPSPVASGARAALVGCLYPLASRDAPTRRITLHLLTHKLTQYPPLIPPNFPPPRHFWQSGEKRGSLPETAPD